MCSLSAITSYFDLWSFSASSAKNGKLRALYSATQLSVDVVRLIESYAPRTPCKATDALCRSRFVTLINQCIKFSNRGQAPEVVAEFVAWKRGCARELSTLIEDTGTLSINLRDLNTWNITTAAGIIAYMGPVFTLQLVEDTTTSELLQFFKALSRNQERGPLKTVEELFCPGIDPPKEKDIYFELPFPALQAVTLACAKKPLARAFIDPLMRIKTLKRIDLLDAKETPQEMKALASRVALNDRVDRVAITANVQSENDRRYRLEFIHSHITTLYWIQSARQLARPIEITLHYATQFPAEKPLGLPPDALLTKATVKKIALYAFGHSRHYFGQMIRNMPKIQQVTLLCEGVDVISTDTISLLFQTHTVSTIILENSTLPPEKLQPYLQACARENVHFVRVTIQKGSNGSYNYILRLLRGKSYVCFKRFSFERSSIDLVQILPVAFSWIAAQFPRNAFAALPRQRPALHTYHMKSTMSFPNFLNTLHVLFTSAMHLTAAEQYVLLIGLRAQINANLQASPIIKNRDEINKIIELTQQNGCPHIQRLGKEIGQAIASQPKVITKRAALN